MGRVQIIAILASLSFLGYVLWKIKKGQLREEYAFIWILSTFVLIVFSFWRDGIDIIAHTVGVYEAPNLIFTAAIFATLIYLLHLSLTVSKLQTQNKTLAQELALLRQKMEKKG